MIPRATPALLQALALRQNPQGPRPAPNDLLPDDVLTLLRIVAAESHALESAHLHTGQSRDTLREAAAFYLQQVLFAPRASSYRVLGVNPNQTDERIKEHYRWLVRWLHPDRNREEWDAVFANRVNRAWQDLRTPDRRARYDAQLLTLAANEPEIASISPAAAVKWVVRDIPDMPTRSYRWLPAAIFGVLTVAMMVAVSLFSVLSWMEARPAIADIETVAAVVPPSSILVPRPAVVAPSIHASVVATPAAAVKIDAEPIATKPLRVVVSPAAPRAPMAIAKSGITRPRLSSRHVDVAVAYPQAVPAKTPSVLTLPMPPAEVVVASLVTSAAPGKTLGLDNSVVNELLGRLSGAYSDGDMAALRNLFAFEEQHSDVRLKLTIASYELLFRETNQRLLTVRDVTWAANGTTVTIAAHYEEKYVLQDQRKPHRYRGNMQLDVRKEDAQWRIFRLRFNERQG